MHRILAAWSAAVLLWAPAVGAAAPGSISGFVRTSDARPVPQVPVVVEGRGVLARVATGPEGQYRVEALPAGEYSLRVEAPGFTVVSASTVSVGADEVRLDLTLAPAPVREHVVVSATRSAAALSTLGVSASVLDAESIAERQAPTLLDLLPELPGIASARAGGVGAQASAFVRGGASNATRVLLDGVPINQPGGAYDFGGDLPLELERVELVRGAAGSLYGSDALAGVVHLATRRAGLEEAPSLRVGLEGGSFDWRRAEAGSSGRSGRFDWNAGLLRLDTENQQPNSAFEQTALAASLGFETTQQSSLRLVLRGADGRTGTPGPTAFGRPDLDAFIERRDAAASLQYRVAGSRASHDVQLFMARAHALSVNPLDSGPYLPRYDDREASFPIFDFTDPEGFQNDAQRLGLAYQLGASLGRRSLLSAGLDLERETGEIGSRSQELLTPARTNVGAWLQGRLLLGDRLFATLGGRVERNASYGTEAVPRVALAFRLRGGDRPTTLRASAGAGIKEPSFLESFGVSFYAQGNPDLRPERSRSVDVGIEQRLYGNRLRLEATLFDHDYRDQIAYQVSDYTTFQGTFVNLGHTRARGLELAVEAAPTRALRLSGQYTLLDGEVLVSSSEFDPVFAVGQPLLRRPRHQGSFNARYGTGRWSLGSTLLFVGRRLDSDFLGLGLTESAGYARWDARARVAIVGGLEAVLVAENLLDARYQEALGYPALGRSLRLGVRFASGGGRRP